MKGKAKLLYLLLPVVLVTAFVLYVAYRTRHVSTPRRKWKRFNQRGTKPLDENTCKNLQGIYTIYEGNDFFGETAVLKWSYTHEKNKTIHHLSLFCKNDGIYIICEGRQHGNQILLSGYWRKATANGSGLVRLILPANSTTDLAMLLLQGSFGNGSEEPIQPVSFHYQQALTEKTPFEIIGHRGGSRNVDFLPVSENSLEILKMAASLGATGVEIDVRLTKDNVPVIFHDSFLSIHTVKEKLYAGLLHNYTLKELKKIELRKGGFVPTLEECLYTMLYQTPLQTVWLDIKKQCDLRPIQQLQQQYMERAKAIGRSFTIYIGIPNEKILACFKELHNYRQIPSLIEGNLDVAINNNADVWTTQYIKGIREDDVAKIHAAGKKAYVWTLDIKTMIKWFVSEGGFDGVVTNAPSVVAHWHYTQADEAKALPQNHKQAANK